MMPIGHIWAKFTESLAVIAIIVTALGLMLGIVKPADAVKQIASIMGALVILLLMPQVLANLWSEISMWQKVCLAVLVIGILQWRRRRESLKKREK